MSSLALSTMLSTVEYGDIIGEMLNRLSHCLSLLIWGVTMDAGRQQGVNSEAARRKSAASAYRDRPQ